MERRKVLALLLAAACGRVGFDEARDDAGPGDDAGPLPPPPPAFVDGARLRMGLWRAGATTLPAGWFDTQLGLDCTFRPASDGVLRCLPIMPTVLQFADAQCTQPLAAAPTATLTCGTSATYAVDHADVVYTITGTHAGPRYQGTTSSCTPSTMELLPTTYFALGASPDPAIFVAGEERSTVRAGDVSYRELVAEDGAREVLRELFDHVHGATCALSPSSTQGGPCVSSTLPLAPVRFADAACTIPLLVTPTAPADGRVRVRFPGLCDDTVRVLALGAPHAGAVYAQSSSGCQLDTDGTPAYALGPDETAAYPRLEPSAGPGADRVRPLVWRSATGVEVIDPRTLWDAAAGAPCRPVVDDATGSAVCGPVFDRAEASVFSDPACTTPLGFGIAQTDCRARGGALHFPPAGGPDYICEGLTWDVWPFSEEIVVAAAYAWSAFGCKPIDLVANPLRGLSGAASAASFAPVTRTR